MNPAVSSLPVLVVEDDADLREAVRDTLVLAGVPCLDAADGPSALRILASTAVGLVLSDVQMRPMDGHALLREVKTRAPHLPFVLMTAYGEIPRAVEAMRAGAADYLTKPFEPAELLARVDRYRLAPRTVDAAADETATGETATGGAIAASPAMRALLDLAGRVAASDATVLIAGESGSGKEVVARYVHRHSPRAGGPFVAINCAAIPDNLLEATLFGHEKGAFTGAAGAHAGKFEQAQGGTLLLDEVSEMPLALQAKLLRVLQEREVERLGGSRPVRLDVRVIATTNRDLGREVSAGRFREDLWYRLNVFPLDLPPLRERPEDVLPLANLFLKRYSKNMNPRFSGEAERQLTAYGWPGNIRELENVAQRALILSPDQIVEAHHLRLPAAQKVFPAAASGAGSGAGFLQVTGTRDVKTPADFAMPVVANDPSARGVGNNPADIKAPDDIKTDIKTMERRHILDTLAAVDGSRKRAAERLGMSERTLRHKLQQYRALGLDVRDA